MTAIQQVTVVVADQDPSQALGKLALFLPDGSPIDMENLPGGGGGAGTFVEMNPDVQRVQGELTYQTPNWLFVANGNWPWKMDGTNGSYSKEYFFAAIAGFPVSIDQVVEDALILKDFPTDEQVFYSNYEGANGILGTSVDGTLGMALDHESLENLIAPSLYPTGLGMLDIVTGRTFDGSSEIDEWGTTVGRLIYWSDGTLPIIYAGWASMVQGLPPYPSWTDPGVVVFTNGGYSTQPMKDVGLGPISGLTSERVYTDVGSMFFDTEVGTPIWWSGTDWVDVTGASV